MASISDGKYVLSGSVDDSLWYGEEITRTPGQTVVFTPTITDATDTIEFGFDTDTTGALAANAIRMASDLLKPYDGGAAGPSVYVPADATEYSLAVALLAEGAQYLLDGKLLYKGGADDTATVYVGTANTDAEGTIDSIKASRTLWVATPTLADTGTVVPTIEDSGSNGLDGTATNVGLSEDGAYFYGSSRINIYSSALNSFFDGGAGTVFIRQNENGPANPAGNFLFRLDSSTSTVHFVTVGSSRVRAVHNGGGSAYKTVFDTVSTNDTCAATWSYLADEFKFFVDGAQSGSTQTGLGQWAGDILTTKANVGANSSTGDLCWLGTLSQFILSNAVATPAEVATISGHIAGGTLTTTILDGIFGAGNYMWLPMDEVYTSDGGALTGIEAGGDGVEWTGATWANTVDGAVNTPPLGAVENSGNLVVNKWYKIITSEVNHFFTGSKAGDTIRAWLTTTLDANNTVQALSASTLHRSTSSIDSPYVYISANWTTGDLVPPGVFAALDDPSNPLNFLVAYMNGSQIVVGKVVNGVYTNLAAVAAAYSADAPLILRTLPNATAGIDWWVIYNGAYVANGTVTDAGIISNTLHGLFSTSSDNVCSDVQIYPATGHSVPGAA
jgi:hypothetical protein